MSVTHIIKGRPPMTETPIGTGVSSERWQPKSEGEDRKTTNRYRYTKRRNSAYFKV